MTGDPPDDVAGTTAARPEQAGLDSAEAARRLAADGPNRLPARGRSPVPLLLLREMVHFFALLLWGAAGLALLAGMPQLAVAIVVVVLFNGVFAFAQEYRADQAGRRLRELIPADVTVRRDGRRTVVRAADLVAGDVVLLEAGDRISADLRLAEVHALAVNESTLTGESVPVRPRGGDAVLAGTFVVEGQAEAVVTATGARTRLAAIATLTQAATRPPSPLARRLGTVIKIIAVIALGVGTLFFALTLLLGMAPADGFLLALGVTVALVPEGLLPTVTLSLARAARSMASRNALVRHLEAVETLGSATFICTDKTGTLTRNEMTVVEIWTPAGPLDLAAPASAADIMRSAVACSTGRLVRTDGAVKGIGDPMEVALHALALHAGAAQEAAVTRRFPFDPVRRRASAVADGRLHLKGAPDAVLPLCGDTPQSRRAAEQALEAMSERGLRVLAVARRDAPAGETSEEVERDLTLVGLVGLEDPPRDGVTEAIATCRRAGIKLAMITGDHPGTARAIAAKVGLLGPDSLVLTGRDLPADDDALGALLDHDGAVIARVTPEDKLRIARALRGHGHVVAMTGDGVNDGPALREADIGVAMGASGTDVAREAADVVLLDDHFATIVTAVELGRATYANIRRFLTYHLTDNVAELTPFLVWAISGGTVPLALSVLQVLALDIGTDLLPALALGAEPASPRTMDGPARTGALLDRRLLMRVFGVLGPAQATVEMSAFTAVLALGGWALGADPDPTLLAAASGTAFAAVVLGQLANAFACRSQTRWAGNLPWRGNRLLLGAVASEAVLLLVFLGVPPLSGLLGGTLPPPAGWALAALAIPAVIGADALHKAVRSGRAGGDALPEVRSRTPRSPGG
ncbi:cation-translocating P-type ATPase [Planomonospora parontospora]|uniref:cation-translocating P-type ATPase n=1 Tax=Planomonospora parontospora TaxID=58119 RepID=UPI0016712F83|nr:cation-transporting P-type ATPase [Planomonospora parontospora]GGL40937.1 magnesium-transporting ATPase [Planomonospora parontospora subsp. antibiotica]GII18193.1 magnesium-transporting ATPase [Planomonospora parontospora subsp. antibiotica]